MIVDLVIETKGFVRLSFLKRGGKGSGKKE